MKLSISEITKAVSGEAHLIVSPDMEIESFEFDTRKLQDNSLFIPLKGQRDGHDFIDAAISNGAVVTFSEHAIENNISYIKVEDTLTAMQDLAKYVLEKHQPKIIGITGSNGKTTTKDMTAAIIASQYSTYKTQGNFNNQIGLPYTILSMPLETEVLVLEMGMDHKGDISELVSIAQPDVAIVTLIGESHIEYLGSREAIAGAKMEILEGLKSNGVLIIPDSEPLLDSFIEGASQVVYQVGSNHCIVSEEKNGTSFTSEYWPNIVFDIPVIGNYNVNNAIMALLVGQALNVPVSDMKHALSNFDLTKNRTEWSKTESGIDILSDVYNANPTAMKLVLDTFSKLDVPSRKIAVLGDMLELGSLSQEMHESVAKHISPEHLDMVYLYGSNMKYLYEKLRNDYTADTLLYFETNDKESLKNHLLNSLKTKDTVFFKGSNGMGLKEIVDFLLKKQQ